MKVKIDKIRELRIAKGWSEENLAHELDISQPQYGRLENGESEFDFKKLTKLMDIFRVNPLDIIDFEEKNVYINAANGGIIGNNSTFINSHLSKDDVEKMIRKEIEIAIGRLDVNTN